MAPRTSILRATHHSVRPLSTHRIAGPFALQQESTPFPCPYCGHGFYSLGGQARHISQTDCVNREEATLAANRVKRILDLELGVTSDSGQTSKRVRFTESASLSAAESRPSADRTPEHSNSNVNSQAQLPISDGPNIDDTLDDNHPNSLTPERNSPMPARDNLVTHDGGHTYIETYPEPLAGSPINNSRAPPFDFESYMRGCGSLANLDNFNTLELLMTIGLTNKGRDRILKSHAYAGKTPWRNCIQILEDLDRLRHGPSWKVYEIDIKQADGHVRVEYLFGRNIIEVIRSLIGDWTFKDELHYSPTRLWTTKDRKERLYSEAWTGDWWWRMQLKILDKFATIVPLIIATDKTQLSIMCGGQEAYPVYLTIGNIPKSVRRKVNRHATVLLGYLPVDGFSEVKDRDERARLKHKLVHDAMAVLMEPLRRAAKEGVVMECADGRQRRIYPIPAAFEGDWPEQCSMASADEGGCPVCEQDYDHRSHYPNLAPLRTPNATLAALRAYLRNDKDPGELKPLRLKPWWPWWASIPQMNFHASIMPDLLHQLYQGMVKTHVITWTKKVFGAHLIDKCFRAMPGAVGLRHFTRGISKIPGSQWTGRESKETVKQLLPPGRCLILHIAHTNRKCRIAISNGSERALSEFHDNKAVLVALGIYKSLDLLNRVKKLHMATHYHHAIREMGTPDGYNTESPEHLHIIYAKKGWRASSKVRPLPQMTKFVQRYEALRIHRMYIDIYYGCQTLGRTDSRVVYGEDEDAISEGVGRRLAVLDEELDEDLVEDDESEGADKVDDEDPGNDDPENEAEAETEGELVQIQSKNLNDADVQLNPDWSIAIKPTAQHLTCDEIMGRYGAFNLVLRTNEWLHESVEAGALPPLQFVTEGHTFDVWHKFYLHHRPLYFDPDLLARRDTVHAQPPLPVPEGSLRSAGTGNFDTVLFLAKPKESGISRYRAGRVRVIFKLPAHLSTTYLHPLVYLELFTSFSGNLNSSHRMHTISQDMHRGIRRTIVMPLVWVVAACHLVPLFSQFDSDFPFDCRNVLSCGKNFFFNHYSSNFMFGLVDHWRMIQDQAKEAEAAERRANEDEARRIRADWGKAARTRLHAVRNGTSLT